MARPRKPIDLMEVNRRLHISKTEIAERKNTEIKAICTDISAPEYLEKSLIPKFDKIANQLKDINIIADLDVDTLARYLIIEQQYLLLSKKLLSYDIESEEYRKTLRSQDIAFKQVRALSSDLGLTISSRCKLVIPKKEEDKQVNKFAKFGVGASG